MEKVLVTGATGYIGLHCVQQLLNQGYAVNGSVRSPERKEEVFEALQKHNTPTENLNLFTFNLTEDDLAWTREILTSKRDITLWEAVRLTIRFRNSTPLLDALGNLRARDKSGT